VQWAKHHTFGDFLPHHKNMENAQWAKRDHFKLRSNHGKRAASDKSHFWRLQASSNKNMENVQWAKKGRFKLRSTVISGTPKVTPGHPKVTPGAPKVTPGAQKVTPWTAKVTQLDTRSPPTRSNFVPNNNARYNSITPHSEQLRSGQRSSRQLHHPPLGATPCRSAKLDTIKLRSALIQIGNRKHKSKTIIEKRNRNR
jgi:hypothetical protein